MEKLPARAGWHWVKQGLEVFRKQPGALMALFFCCMFLSLISAVIPFIGGLLPSILAPLFSVALLQGCSDADQGKRTLPTLVAIGFKKPMRRPLLQLGGVYLAMTLLALAVMRLMGNDVFSQMAEAGQVRLDREMLENLRMPVLLASLIYLVGWLMTCLAAPLIYWQKMTLGKALFFSVVTVVRELKAFLTAGVMLYLLCQVVVLVVSLLASVIPTLAVTLLFSIVLLMIVLVHCTLYAAYRQIFGPPPVSPEAVSLDKP
jgi:hypothetical protein